MQAASAIFHAFETCWEPGGNLHTDSNGRSLPRSRERAAFAVNWCDGEAWIKRAVGVKVQRRQRRYQREMEGKGKAPRRRPSVDRLLRDLFHRAKLSLLFHSFFL